MTGMQYTLLEKVNSPADLKRLSADELRLCCDELRRYIIEQCSVNPGHLASSLGTVELTAALHYVFDTPDDKIVWDVGHQTYAHKILTGRREAFRTNRRLGGLSGFPRMAESPYDAFGGGHASVSISAAFGMAKAAELRGEKRQVVAVIGDSSMTGGLAFEGLNNAGASKRTNLLVILNDNDMAIDKATGALRNYLLKISTSVHYNRFKQRLWGIMSHTPCLLHLCQKAGNAVKHGLLNKSNFFESLNFRYFGPVDGHDLKELVRVLRVLRDIEGPKLLHVMTVKGKGYRPAENDQSVWHAPGKFNPETGERVQSSAPAAKYQDVFGRTLLDLARRDPRVVGVTPAMASGCSMNVLQSAMPERVFDVGIAEGHAVTFSAGLAAGGLRPFCNIYSSFMQRAYDNVIHDVAIQNLPVVMCLDRGGLVGEDGVTHHGVFDLAAFPPVPNLTVAAPMNESELRNMMYTALEAGTPFMIRYPRGCGAGVPWRDVPFEALPVGRGRRLREGSDVALLSIGTAGNFAAEAARRAAAEGLSVAHYDLRFAKPLDEELLREVGRTFRKVLTVEDGAVRGGVGEAVAAFFPEHGYAVSVRTLGIGDAFVEHGTPEQLRAQCGYDADGILHVLKSF
ncbi:1-deoxy-D-xylulose-5-phosphate synthase [Alistipes sp. CHKCI003]|uniref:1-deoxy-D-xylulose-5-phosphate synthase n=2 Tax=Alistipes TaxID=239759 RepID=UPI0007A89494|nr:1-deoxy-D-xylulose-5-phosphate synthase [Alistipes sp. CHKCI003]